MRSHLAEKVKVFISSVQNKVIEDLRAERAEVVRIVENYSPTVVWAFEHTPASDLSAEEHFLKGVRDCDLFLLVLGSQVTEAITKEYNEAVRTNKPIFAFVKNIRRTRAAETLLKLVRGQSKYGTFNNTQDLAALVESSLDSFLLRLVKNNQRQKEYPEVIRALSETKFAIPLQSYARQLLASISTSFEAEVTHYLNLVPHYLQDVSKFYVPTKAKVAHGASETVDDILTKHHRVVLLGSAGSGKTTELLNFTVRLSRRAIEDIELRQVPVYVDMRSWTEGNVISCIEDTFARYGLHLGKPTVQSLLKNYKVVLLFDGLDEVSPLELVEKVSQIKAVSKTYEGVDIVVSCRAIRYVSDLGFVEAPLEPLQDADIIKYMVEFTGGEFYLGRFYSWPSSLRELSKHPLMLSFIANIVAEGSATPTSLADVYDKYISFLFDRWEIRKGAKIDPLWKKRALVDLAIDMQLRSHYSLSEDEALGLLRRVVSGEAVNFSSIDLLNELLSSGIIRKSGNRYTFWHASFREYLASQLLISRIKSGGTISEFVLNPAWEPVLVYASRLFDNSPEISSFLFEILSLDLYLYTRCLTDASSPVSPVPTPSDKELSLLILGGIIDVRERTIERWLPALLPILRPNVRHGKISRPAIVGEFSSIGGGYLAYGYACEKDVGGKVRLLEDFPAGTTLDSLGQARIISNSITRGLPLTEAGLTTAHRLALEDIWKELEGIIRAKSLIEPPRLIYELTQDEVLRLARQHILPVTVPASISAIEAEVSKLLAGYGRGQVILGVQGKDIHLNSLLIRLRVLANSGYTSIGSPLLPERDRRPRESNYVTQFYEDKTLVEYVRLYFIHFLEGYAELVKLNFPLICHRLNFHQLLPVRVVAEIERPAPSKEAESLGRCDYYFEPLEGGRQNEVVVSLNQKISEFLSTSSNLQDAMGTWLEKLKRYGRWNSAVTVSTVKASLGTFFGERNPIRCAVYDRILKDLHEVCKVEGGFRL